MRAIGYYFFKFSALAVFIAGLANFFVTFIMLLNHGLESTVIVGAVITFTFMVLAYLVNKISISIKTPSEKSFINENSFRYQASTFKKKGLADHFFRRNASLKEKSFTIFWLVWMVFAIYGMWGNFETKIGSNHFIIWGSLLLGILTVYPIYIDKHPESKIAYTSLRKRFFQFVFFTLLSILFSWCALALSIPAIYTVKFGERVVDIVEVTKKIDGIGRSCYPKIKTSKNKNRYCVSRDFFNSISEGDSIIIYGKESQLGYKAIGFESK